MDHRVARAALLIACAAAGSPALAAAGHSHGVATLDIAVDGEIVTLRLASPLDSLLGFERAPGNDAERGQVRAMAQALRSGGAFAPTPAARCHIDRITLVSPVLAPELLGETGARAASHAGDEHAELDGTFVYRCENAKALQDIDVMLFDAFGKLRRIDARLAGPKGQSAFRLDPRARRMRW